MNKSYCYLLYEDYLINKDLKKFLLSLGFSKFESEYLSKQIEIKEVNHG